MHAYAHATFVAVAEGVDTTDAAETTFLTMEGLLGLRHPQVTHGAVVFSKHCAALGAEVAEMFLSKKESNRERFGGRHKRIPTPWRQ